MAINKRHMNPSWVEQKAEQLDKYAQLLKVIREILDAQMRILETTAFIGQVGGALAARKINVLQPSLQKAEELCKKLAEKARISAKEWRDAEKDDGGI